MDSSRIGAIIAKVYMVVLCALVFQFAKEEHALLVLLTALLPYMLIAGFQSAMQSALHSKIWVRIAVGVLWTVIAFAFAYYKNWLNV